MTVELARVDFVNFIAGVAAKTLKVGENAALTGLAADFDLRLVVVTTQNRVKYVPFERVDAFEVATAPEQAEGTTPKEGKKNGKRTGS